MNDHIGQDSIEISTGRRIGLLELGDPDGYPVFYMHGFPASRVEARLVEASLPGSGVRLLALDRPGFGRSDPQPGRTLRDWPHDVAAVADRLGIGRFALLGVSGGGPATLALARWLPDRVRAASVVCGLGPLCEPGLLAAMQWPARCSFGLIRRAPRIARPLFARLVGPLLGRLPELGLRLLSVAAPAADAALFRDPRVRALLAEGVRESFRQGGNGATTEMALLASPWGFSPAELRVPVQFWHGRDDATVPCLHSAFLAERVPGSELRVLPGEGHFSLPIRHVVSILKALLAKL